MISESETWITELQRNVGFMHEKLSQHVWKPQSHVALEKRIMLSCYIARKLRDSGKIEDSKYEKEIELYEYKSNGSGLISRRPQDLMEAYATEKPIRTTRQLHFVFNQIIHSHVFVLAFETKTQLSGFLFNSDRTKDKVMFFVKLRSFVEAISPLANMWIGSTIMELDDNGNLRVANENQPA